MTDIEKPTATDLMRILDPEMADPEMEAAKYAPALARSISRLAAAFDGVRPTQDSPLLVITGDPQSWETSPLMQGIIDSWRTLGYQLKLLPYGPQVDRRLMQLPPAERETAWAEERERRLTILHEAGGILTLASPRGDSQAEVQIDPNVIAAYSQQVLQALRNIPARRAGHNTSMPGLSRNDARSMGVAWRAYVFPVLLSLLLVDWPTVEQNMDRLSAALENALEVTIAGPSYRLIFSLDGFRLYPSTTRNNLIGAELFTAPVIDSVDGEFTLQGSRYVGPGALHVRDLHIRLEKGVIVEANAAEGAEAFRALFTEAFERPCIGEIGLGGEFNPALWPYTLLSDEGYARFVRFVLLSEKIGDHIAFGDAYPDRQRGETRYRMDNGSTFKAPGGIRGHFDLVMGRRKTMDAITSYGEPLALMRDGYWVDQFADLSESSFWEQFTPMQRAMIARTSRWAETQDL